MNALAFLPNNMEAQWEFRCHVCEQRFQNSPPGPLILQSWKGSQILTKHVGNQRVRIHLDRQLKEMWKGSREGSMEVGSKVWRSCMLLLTFCVLVTFGEPACAMCNFRGGLSDQIWTSACKATNEGQAEPSAPLPETHSSSASSLRGKSFSTCLRWLA